MKIVPYYELDEADVEPHFVSGLEEMSASTLRGMFLNVLNGYPMFEDVEVTYETSSRWSTQQVSDLLIEYISSTKAAALIGWTTATLRRYRNAGKGPKGYRKTGKTSGVYPLHEVMKFVAERMEKRR